MDDHNAGKEGTSSLFFSVIAVFSGNCISCTIHTFITYLFTNGPGSAVSYRYSVNRHHDPFLSCSPRALFLTR